jgi:C-terminal processing protease CtpA/Prc
VPNKDQNKDQSKEQPKEAKSETAATDKAPDKSNDKSADKAKPAPATEIVFDGINRRTRLLPIGMGVDAARVSPDGKQIAFLATAANETNLYVYSLDELAKEPPVAKQLTSTAGAKSRLQWSEDSKELWLLDENKPVKVTVEDGKSKPVATSAELDVDFEQEKGEMFREAWTWMRDHFHDAKMNGADWNAVREEIEPRVATARTYDEVRRLLNLMIGELNASHLGARGQGGRTVTGRIGLRFDRNAVERDGRFVISEVIPLAPAAITRKVHPGDVLVAVDGKPLTKSTNLDQLLEYKVGKEVRLTVETAPAAGGPAGAAASARQKVDVDVQPVNSATEKQLVYRHWVDRNREYVRRISNGHVGYVHMIDMSSDSLAQLAVDLDAENQTRDAVVVDIRNNNGGFVNAYALDVFTRRPYLNMTFRDRPTVTARTLLGQRALQRPTVLVTNQHSLSDAEDFSEGYHALGLGKVVGEPTAGWIIYTSGAELIDGSAFRLPFITITTEKGEPMELHPRPVDIQVSRAFGEDGEGKDTQLDAAVKTVLGK